MSLSRQNSARQTGRFNSGLNAHSKKGQANAIKVIARFKPSQGETCVEEMGPHHVKIYGVQQPFVFDSVLGPETEQHDVFEKDIKPTVEGVLCGYNGCVLAYGQTGSGKSHTMMGSSGRERGVIPRIIEHIFNEKSEQVEVSVGYMEIYNEKVRDLLADQPESGGPNLESILNIGSVNSASSNSAGPNGSVGAPNGSINAPNGTFSTFSGTSNAYNRPMSTPNGTSSALNGTFSTLNGSSTTLNGSSTTPNGSSSTSSGSISTPNGSSTSISTLSYSGPTAFTSTTTANAATSSSSVNSNDLKVHEQSGGGGFYVKGLKKVAVSRASEVFTIMHKGNRNRSTAATLMNQSSSRSHSLFLIDITTPTTRSKLVLVDLAGSEKVAKTGVRGAMLEEASNINKSLTSLGMVVNALAANQALVSKTAGQSTNLPNNSPSNTPPPLSSNASSEANTLTQTNGSHGWSGDINLSHVPFRDSKLTRILQDSLSGNSRTCLIVHCSLALTHSSETLSTLRFGLRAKSVQTQVMVNYVPSSTSAANVPLELLNAQRQLNAQLVRENRRLHAQHQRVLTQRSVQRRRIEHLLHEINAVQTKNTNDETFLSQELGELGPRLADLLNTP